MRKQIVRKHGLRKHSFRKHSFTKHSTLAKFFGLLLALALVASACASDSSQDATSGQATSDTETASGDVVCEAGNISVSGSSTVEPISRRAAELYEDVCADAVITVDGPGTGDGFKLFCGGATDISNASRQIKQQEIDLCEEAGVTFTELKVAFDGIAVLTNPNNEIECLAFPDLYALLGGKSEGFAKWNDADSLAAELGSTVAPFPNADLEISAPGTESGTYDSFIEIVLEGIGEEQEGEDGTFIRQDFSGNAADNVIIEGIAGSDTSLGWVGFAFAEANKDQVKALQISEDAGGDCVAPTIDTIADGSYPVSRGLYIYVNNESVASNSALGGYVDYYLNSAYTESVTKAFGDSGYVELPEDQLTATRDAWAAVSG